MTQHSGIPVGVPHHRPPVAAPVLSLDIGGSMIRAGLVSPVRLSAVSSVREVVATAQTPTPGSDGPGAVLTAVIRVTTELLRDRPVVAACGAAVAGVVDTPSGTVVSAGPSLPDLAGVPVAALLAERLGVPVALDNDVNAFVLGEAVAGAAAGAGSALMTTVGSGVGGGILAGGLIWRGAHSAAGEIGHLPAPGAGDRPCPCGARGHLESVATGPAMSARHAEQTGTALPFPALAARAVEGDGAAAAAVAEGATALGRALAGLANVLDPEVVVVGGDVTAAGPAYWTPLRRAFEQDLLPAARGGISLQPASLGDQAVLVGAAELVLRSTGIGQ